MPNLRPMSDDQRDVQLDLFSVGTPPSVANIAQAFEPARLTQARVLREWSKAELAEVLPVTAAAIGQYEAGVVKPRAEMLPALAKALRVPVEFFAAGRPLGRLDATNAHFRSLRSTRVKDRARAAAYVEQVWELTHALEKRVRLPDVALPALPEGSTPVEAAALLREAWGIRRGPVAHLAALMEDHGIVVCLISMTDEAFGRVSAFSTDSFDRPIVVVTPERLRSVYRYRFTCAHELGHLMLHPTPIPGDRQQEREADQFAAEFLTPSVEVEPLLPSTMRLASLDGISRTWGVSVESLIYRMGELGRVSDVSIRRAHQRLAGMAELRTEEPLVAFPGEVPSLLREAVEVLEQNGFSRAQLADELRWTTKRLAWILGEDDPRPVLRPVR